MLDPAQNLSKKLKVKSQKEVIKIFFYPLGES
jgi:hypothetical protein